MGKNKQDRRRQSSWLSVLNNYHVGQDVKATVVGQIEYGMLVKLGTGIVALLHRREIDWISIDIEPMQVLQLGENINVRIMRIDTDRQRMSVSRRVLLPNPHDEFVKTAQVGTIYFGTVWKYEDYGAFVEIAPGVHGLLHINEMEGAIINRDGSARTPGDLIRVCIIMIDSVNRRISLASVKD